jgi:hypothetical protein
MTEPTPIAIKTVPKSQNYENGGNEKQEHSFT